MTTTAEAPTTPSREPKGDTTLRNIRVEDDLWFEAEEPCRRQFGRVGRSGAARRGLQDAIDRETDPLWLDLAALAKERETTPEALQRYVVEQYLAKVKRDRETQRKRREGRTSQT